MPRRSQLFSSWSSRYSQPLRLQAPNCGCTTMTDHTAVADNDMAGESPQNRRVVKLVLHTLLIAVSIVMLYPLLWMLASSFRTNGEILNNLSIIPESLNPRNYIAGW